MTGSAPQKYNSKILFVAGNKLGKTTTFAEILVTT
jgi:hypothetical protein